MALELSYFANKGGIYRSTDEGVEKLHGGNEQFPEKLKKWVYLDIDEARKIYRKGTENRGAIPDEVFQRKHYQYSGGKVLFITNDGSLGKSSIITGRNPPFSRNGDGPTVEDATES